MLFLGSAGWWDPISIQNRSSFSSELPGLWLPSFINVLYYSWTVKTVADNRQDDPKAAVQSLCTHLSPTFQGGQNILLNCLEFLHHCYFRRLSLSVKKLTWTPPSNISYTLFRQVMLHSWDPVLTDLRNILPGVWADRQERTCAAPGEHAFWCLILCYLIFTTCNCLAAFLF